jgi:hypothetical protein
MILLALTQGISFAAAQTTTEKIAAIPKINKPLPFKAGESLFYEVGATKLIFSGTIGELKMTVSKQRKPTCLKSRPM